MHLYYNSLKGDTWAIRGRYRGGMLGKLAAAGTAAVAKCVAPGGATHEQVDVAAARLTPRRRDINLLVCGTSRRHTLRYSSRTGC